MLGLWAPVITIGVVLDVVVIKVTIIIYILGDITRENLVEVSDAVTKIRGGRGWSGWLGRGQRDEDDGEN